MKHKHLQPPILTAAQLETFATDGVLVVENFLSETDIERYKTDIHNTLARHGVDTLNLNSSGQQLAALSSTNGSGGVLDIFYEKWKIELATNPNLFAMTCELWANCLYSDGESKPEVTNRDYYKWHPHGSFDPRRGYMYVDRVGYRIPTNLARQLGQSKKRPLQRSLTPHLDCCPEHLWEEAEKWRPIQSFVALGDARFENQGGFEAASGFHREFHHWAASRLPTRHQRVAPGDGPPSLCKGEYTHIRPNEDRSVLVRVKHVPVSAGSVVFWDHR